MTNVSSELNSPLTVSLRIHSVSPRNTVVTYMLTGFLKNCLSVAREIKTKHIKSVRLFTWSPKTSQKFMCRFQWVMNLDGKIVYNSLHYLVTKFYHFLQLRM